MKKLFITAWVALVGCTLASPALAQELVTNGNFEARNSAPQAPFNVGPYRSTPSYTYYDDLSSWDITPAAPNTNNSNSSSYVASDGAANVNTTTLYGGFQPHSGNSCTLIGRHDEDASTGTTYRQYDGLITHKLAAPLLAGHNYQVSFWMMRLPGSPYHNKLELSITDADPSYDSGNNTLVPSPGGKVLTSPDVQQRFVWTQVSGTIYVPANQTANQWVTVGCAREPQTYDRNAQSEEGQGIYGIYYAVDDVSITDAGLCGNGYGITIVGKYHKSGQADQSISNGGGSSVSTGTYTITLTALTKQSYSPTQATFSPWSFGDSGSQGAYNFNNNTQGSVTLQQLYAGVSFSATATNPCGERASFSYRLYASSNSRPYVISPNPASESMSLSLLEEEKDAPASPLPKKGSATPSEDSTPFTAYLYNSMGNLVKTLQVPAGQLTGSIQVQDLPAGIYILRTGTGKDAPSQRIQVVH